MESNKSNAESGDAVVAIDVTTDIEARTSAAAEESEPKNNNNLSTSPDSSASDGSSSSDDASDIAIADKDLGEDDEDLQATPGHLHALANRTSPARLLPKVHSDSKLAEKLLSPAAQRRRSASRSVNSSRSSSPSHGHSIPRSGSIGLMSSSDIVMNTNLGKDVPNNNNSSNNITSSAAASYASSSLDGKFDPDLLLDRLGFIDLDPPLPHEIRCGPLAAPGSIDGKSNNAGGLTPVNERLSEETLDDCHAFQDLVIKCGNMSSTMSMPSVAHSSLSGMRSDMSVGSIGSALSMGSFTKGGAAGGGHSREGSVAGGSFVGDGDMSVLLGTLDEVGEEEEGSVG
uniref:Uncharacterized protein n=1 Tax=Skeletonema marinoi TaxID=267567 RepID=A0A7S2LXP8_9STRA|mmetsp:Transcript_31668/g.53608  ORF Transcript_31668/g.53608 Transcript_31668/m.53608 type:complete len:343 (+) Transcript_31668:114-1142(+)